MENTFEDSFFDIRKALDLSTTNNNNVLTPPNLQPKLVEWSRRQPAIRNIIKRQTSANPNYNWDIVTDEGSAFIADDGAQITLSDAAFDDDGVKMAFIYGAGWVTNPARYGDAELLDVFGMRLSQATKTVIKKENAAIYAGVSGKFPGLKASLTSSTTYSIIGDKATANSSMFSTMETALMGEGYSADVFVVTPRIYNVMKQAAFNNVRFLGVEGDAIIGFALNPQKNLTINGVRVVMDKYAETPVAVTTETLTLVSGKTYSFANQNVYLTAGKDQAGTSWAAPTFSSGGAATFTAPTSAGGLQYVTFASTPSSPTATYTYGSDNVYCLNLDPSELVIPEMISLTVETDIGKEIDYDRIGLRVKEYVALAVLNTKAHVIATNVAVPTPANF